MKGKTTKAANRTAHRFRVLTGRCNVCHANQRTWQWEGPNVLAVAAKHTDFTGHETYVEITTGITFNIEETVTDE